LTGIAAMASSADASSQNLAHKHVSTAVRMASPSTGAYLDTALDEVSCHKRKQQRRDPAIRQSCMAL
jgi:hypothetical protein